MRKSYVFSLAAAPLILAVLFFSMGPLSAADVSGSPEVRVSAERFFDSFFTGEIKKGAAPGAVAAFVDCSEVPVLAGYGYSNAALGTKADPDKTLFFTGSITKLITATAVMKLCAMGLVKLDDPVSFRLENNFLKEIKGRPVTFKSLLTHTAGFDPGKIAPLFFEKNEVSKPLSGFLRYFCPRCVRPPLKKFAYSNFSGGLSGALVEAVSGLEYGEFVRINIFEKLDMRDSFFAGGQPESSEIAVGYEAAGNKFVPVENRRHTMIPASGLLTTAADMANFMTAHLQSGRLGNSTLWESTVSVEMQKSLFAVGADSIPATFDRFPKISAMAAGFRVSEAFGLKILWHSGTLKGYAAGLYLFPEKRCGVFIAYNSGDAVMRQRFIKRFISEVIKNNY